MKVDATESGVKVETPKSLKRIPLPFSVDPNPRHSVPGKICFLGFIKLVNYYLLQRHFKTCCNACLFWGPNWLPQKGDNLNVYKVNLLILVLL